MGRGRSARKLALLTWAAASAFLFACTGTVGSGGPGQTGGQSGSVGGAGSSGPGGPGGGAVPGGGGSGGGGLPGVAGGSGTGAMGGTGAVGGAGNVGVGGAVAAACVRDPVVAPRRLVRLTLRQVTNAIRVLLNATVAAQVVQKAEVADLSARSFPPLASQQEGAFVTEGIWSKSEEIGKTSAQYVRDNYATVTGCRLADTTDTCAQQYIGTFAEKAFRRPLDATERASVLQVFTEAKSFGAPVPDALQTAIWAVLTSPHFLYRGEFGSPVAATTGAPVPLTPHEMASDLAFFITDGPPDVALLDAAAKGRLATPAGIAVEVDRMLLQPVARENLQQAVFAYFGIGNLDSVVIDPMVVPEFTLGLRNAMYRETQEFLKVTLWGGQLGDLLTSRKSVINADLAKLYGVTFPAGAATTPDNFVAVDLPAVRSGLLTQAGFLSARARPDKDSVVGRALMLSATMLCANNPEAPPDALKDAIDAAITSMANNTERQKANYRMTTSPCSACHLRFDAFGLALENFDLIGRHRANDPQGRPIDPSVTLPADLGGARVKDVVEMGQQMANSGIFATCMTRNLMKYALAEGNVNTNDCAVQTVAQQFLAGQRTFSNLVREIAISKTIGVRASGG